MIGRPEWINRIGDLWTRRSIVWLSGVRRIGKTSLARQIAGATYFNCDLPSVRQQLENPEFFLHNQTDGSSIILDEIHRLPDPSSVLKIAADEFPQLRILATGSSSLAATRKFRDSLPGRKHSVRLTPVLWRERTRFGQSDIDQRLLHGGFPECVGNPDPDPLFFEEWIDSFYARDIQELFAVRNRTAFLDLLRIVLMQSGGQLQVNNLSSLVGSARPTVLSHLDAMEVAHAIVRVLPYHGGGRREIVKQPKVYGFDTGIVAHVRGWREIRDTDRGYLWEHLVLDELRFLVSADRLRYWRDKSGREIDFVLPRSRRRVDAFEAKVSPDAFRCDNLKAFREHYPEGKDHVVCPHVPEPYEIHCGGRRVTVCGTEHLGALIDGDQLGSS